jgi:hypothetical protein
VPPIITTLAGATTRWTTIVEHALGAEVARGIVKISPGESSFKSTAYDAFKSALLKAPQKIADRKQYLGVTWVAQGFDAIIMDALAIDEAKSTDSAKVAPLMAQIANGVSGATTVHSYAEGVKEIAAGHRVHYVGAGGPMVFNESHNIVTPFEVFRYGGAKAGWGLLPRETLTPEQIKKAMS